MQTYIDQVRQALLHGKFRAAHGFDTLRRLACNAANSADWKAEKLSRDANCSLRIENHQHNIRQGPKVRLSASGSFGLEA
eukprot:2273202-Pleurochrysis_carterae.AAC.2